MPYRTLECNRSLLGLCIKFCLITEGAQVLKKLCGSLQDKDYNKSDLIPPSASNEVYIVFKSGPKKSFEPLKKFSIAITPKYKSKVSSACLFNKLKYI